MANTQTPTGMMMFPHLFVPRPVVQGGDPRFSIILVFSPEQQQDPRYAQLRQGVADAIDAKFGAGKCRDANWLRQVKFSSPFRDASEKSQYQGFNTGHIFIAPWTKTRPGLVDGRLQSIMAPADVFAGQLARAWVSFYAYQVSGNTGCSLMLENVQVVKSDMPRMDGRQAADKVFDAVNEDQDIPAEYRHVSVGVTPANANQRAPANSNAAYSGELSDELPF